MRIRKPSNVEWKREQKASPKPQTIAIVHGTICQTACGWFAGVAVATPPNQLQRFILTDYFNNYKFSNLKKIRPLIKVIELKHVGAVLM